MFVDLQIKQGKNDTVPDLKTGEFGLAKDTNQLYIGTKDGNMEMTNQRFFDEVVAHTVVDYTKEDGVHALQGDKLLHLDIFSLTFKVEAEFVEGDKVSYDGVEYDVYSGGELATEGFFVGDVVTINFDKKTKRCFLATGGGSGLEGLRVNYNITANDESDLTGSTLTVNGVDYPLTGKTQQISFKGLFPDATFTATLTSKTGYIFEEEIPSYTTNASEQVKDFDLVIIKNATYFKLNLSTNDTDFVMAEDVTIKIGEAYDELFGVNASKTYELNANTEYDFEIVLKDGYILTTDTQKIVTGNVDTTIEQTFVIVKNVTYFDITIDSKLKVDISPVEFMTLGAALLNDTLGDVSVVTIKVVNSKGEVIIDTVFGTATTKRIELPPNETLTIILGDITGCVTPESFTITTGAIGSVITKSVEYLQDVYTLSIDLSADPEDDVSGMTITVKLEDEIVKTLTYNNETIELELLSNTDYTFELTSFKDYIVPETIDFTTGSPLEDEEWEYIYVYDVAYLDLTLTHSEGESVANQIITIKDGDGETVSNVAFGSTNPKRYNLLSETDYIVTFEDYTDCPTLKAFSFNSGDIKNATSYSTEYTYSVAYFDLTLTHSESEDVSEQTITIKKGDETVYEGAYGEETPRRFNLEPETTYTVEFEEFANCFELNSYTFTTGTLKSVSSYSTQYIFNGAYFKLTLSHSENEDVSKQIITIKDNDNNVIYEEAFGDENPRTYELLSSTNYTVSFEQFDGCKEVKDYSFSSGGLKNVTSYSLEYVYDIAYLDLSLSHSEDEDVSNKKITIKDSDNEVIYEGSFGNVSPRTFDLLSETSYTVDFEDYDGCFSIDTYSFTTGDVKTTTTHSAKYVYDIAYFVLTLSHSEGESVESQTITIKNELEETIYTGSFGNKNPRTFNLLSNTNYTVTFEEYEDCLEVKSYSFNSGVVKNTTSYSVEYVYDIAYFDLTLSHSEGETVSSQKITIKDENDKVIYNTTFGEESFRRYVLLSDTNYTVSFEDYEDCRSISDYSFASGNPKNVTSYSAEYIYDIAYLSLTLTHSEGESVSNQKVTIKDSDDNIVYVDVFGNENPRTYNLLSKTSYTITFADYDGCFSLASYTFTTGNIKTTSTYSKEYVYDIAYFDLTLTHSESLSVANQTITIKNNLNETVYSGAFGNDNPRRFELLSNTNYIVTFENYEDCPSLNSYSFNSGSIKNTVSYSANYVYDVAYFDLTLSANPVTDVSECMVTISLSDGTIVYQGIYGETTPKRYDLKSNTEYIVSFASLDDYPTTPLDYIFTTNGVKSYQSVSKVYEQREVMGFCINEDESDPYESVTYTDDAVGMTPCAMNYATDTMNYGNWKTFIDKIARPCLLNQNGTVLMYLDRENQNYDENGNEVPSSVISDTVNYMVEMTPLYYKAWEVGNKKYYQCSLTKWIDDAVATLFGYENSDVVKPFYMPMFAGHVKNNVMRSLPNVATTVSTTGTNEKIYAQANGDNYSLKPFVHWVHMCRMVYLLGKSLDSQTVFGNGIISTSGDRTTGSLISKGAMHGYNTTTKEVKFLWAEAQWGHKWQRIEGCVGTGYTIKTKEYPDYNFEGADYITMATIPATSGRYLTNTTWSTNGMFPKAVGGSSSTYYADGAWSSSSAPFVLLVGGHWSSSVIGGVSAWNSNAAVSGSDTYYGGSLYFKPPQAGG